MTTKISTRGRIVIPTELRRQDDIEAGQEFEVQRIGPGEYRLTRVPRRRNEGLVKLLLACPAKDWFRPVERTETIDDI